MTEQEHKEYCIWQRDWKNFKIGENVVDQNYQKVRIINIVPQYIYYPILDLSFFHFKGCPSALKNFINRIQSYIPTKPIWYDSKVTLEFGVIRSARIDLLRIK